MVEGLLIQWDQDEHQRGHEVTVPMMDIPGSLACQNLILFSCVYWLENMQSSNT